jgi:hypothetical protein
VEGHDFASFVFDVGLPISINMYYTTSVFFFFVYCVGLLQSSLILLLFPLASFCYGTGLLPVYGSKKLST